jgi:hypothetical protein
VTLLHDASKVGKPQIRYVLNCIYQLEELFRSVRTKEQNGEDGAVAQSLLGADVRSIQEGLGLPDGKPVPQPDAFRFHALDARDPVRQLRCQQSIVGGLHRQFPRSGGDVKQYCGGESQPSDWRAPDAPAAAWSTSTASKSSGTRLRSK